MKNKTSLVPGLLIILLLLGCGLLGNLGIVVKVDDINMTMKAETAVADIGNRSFAVANYKLNIDESDISESNNLKKPSEEDQILFAFALNRTASGPDAERGKFTSENITWFHVYYFKNGEVQKKVLNNAEGFVLLPKLLNEEDEISGAVDISEGSTSLKGAFIAKKINK